MSHLAGRLIPLEAYRGIAAFIVLVHHTFLGFDPSYTGIFPGTRTDESAIGQPYFVIFNGPAAVAFFFTLSGFVLCWSYFRREDSEKLLMAFLKRLPRLMGLVLITTLGSYVLFELGLYQFSEAARLSGSEWLAAFAGTWSHDFEPSLINASAQGLGTFFSGHASYNANLWTMKHEFFGSMIVYMLAAFISGVLRYRYLAYAFIILSASSIFYSEHIFPFVVGLFLSTYLARYPASISRPLSVAILLIGLYLLGYSIPEGAYQWASYLPGSLRGVFPTACHTLGSIAIIFATMANRALFESLNGRFWRELGKLSFPLYLVQMLVIGSISSFAYIQLQQIGLDDGVAMVCVFAITAAFCVGISIPLSRLDDWWVSAINAQCSRIIAGRRRSPPAAAMDSG